MRRERIELALARAIASLPPRALVRLSGKPPIRIDGQVLNPQVQMLARVREIAGAAQTTLDTPESTRARLLRETRAFAGRPRLDGPVRDLMVDGAEGPIPARHYPAPRDATAPGPHPLILFLHGGGHVIGDLDTHDQPCRILCRHSGAHVLSVAYRLAPEHPFPAPFEDARAALAWAHAHAHQLGADPARIVVAGDSAGGNLAATLASTAVREGGPRLALQVLLYPAIDRSLRRPSVELFKEGFFLTEADMDWFYAHYRGDADETDPRLAPLRADLSGLAPAIVVTAGFDPLRDEGEAYAEAMREAGTPVVLRRFGDLPHGFVNMTGLSTACASALVEIGGMVRAALAQPVVTQTGLEYAST